MNDLLLLDKQLPDHDMQKLFLSRTDSLTNLDISDHFGCTSPTANVTEQQLVYKYKLCAIKYPGIISPLTLYDDLLEKTITCDKYSPFVVAQNQTYVYMKLFGSLFFKEAFWALPLTTNFDAYIQWHLIIQRILWFFNSNIAIFHGREKLREPPFKKKKEIYLEFFQDLNSLNCIGMTSVSLCLTTTFRSLSKWLVLPVKEQSLLIRWLLLIQKFMPETQKSSPTCSEKDVQYRPVNHHKNVNNISKNFELNFSLVQKLCTAYLQRSSMDLLEKSFMKHRKHFDDILLVIVFNNAHYEVIPYLETLYRSFFSNLLYCGPGTPKSQETRYSFISYGKTPFGHTSGAMSYECLILAYNMYPYMPGGYFLVADDILLLIHTIMTLPTEKTWFFPKTLVRIGDIQYNRECNKSMCGFYTLWPWWLEYQNATITALLNLREQAKTTQLFNRLVSYKCIDKCGSGSECSNILVYEKKVCIFLICFLCNGFSFCFILV